MPGGRPLKIESVEELNRKVKGYFDDCEKSGRPLTMNGLAYALDITRQTLLNYAEREEFFVSISRARHKIQLFAEESLYDKERFKGAQFSLKNNHGWKDKQEVEVSGNVGLDSQLIAGRQKVQEALKEKDNDR